MPNVKKPAYALDVARLKLCRARQSVHYVKKRIMPFTERGLKIGKI